MKILHISQSDLVGGAARAAFRLHKALQDIGVESEMYVSKKLSGDSTVTGPKSDLEKLSNLLKQGVAKLVMRTLRSSNKVLHSPSLFRSRWVRRINMSDADIVNLHWVGGEMLSVADISRIKKPLVWTLHDMWPICGAEHYAHDGRWREGYNFRNRPRLERGFDINRLSWRRKKHHWLEPFQLVAPSRWMMDCISQSKLMGHWSAQQVPLPLDLETWKPISKQNARQILDLPENKLLLLFGAADGEKDPRKGFGLLSESLELVAHRIPDLELVVFGASSVTGSNKNPLPVHYMGSLNDEISLRLLYSACDVFALPSVQDNLPLTMLEALACGTPIVAFDNTGPGTFLKHEFNGYLARYPDVHDFGRGIEWLLRSNATTRLRENCRKTAESTFEASLVAGQYTRIYENVLLSLRGSK